MPRGVDRVDQARLAGRLWTPAQLPAELRFWYDASDFSTIAGTSGGVSDWRDKSPCGNHLTQATSGKRPTFSPTGFRGQSTISFDGTSGATSDSLQRLSSVTGFVTGEVYQIFSVAQMNTGALTSISICQFNILPMTQQDWELSSIVALPFTREGTNNNITGYFGPSGYFSITAISLDTPLLLSTANTPTNYNIGLNGVLTGASIFTWPTTGTIAQISVGHQVNDGTLRSWLGPISELICFGTGSAAWPVRKRQMVEGYLAWKWRNTGLLNSLAGSHPFKNRPPLIGD